MAAPMIPEAVNDCCWKTCYTLVKEAGNDLVVAEKTCYTLVTDFLPTGFLLQYNYLDSDVGMPRLHHDSFATLTTNS